MKGLVCDIFHLYSDEVEILGSFLALSKKKVDLIKKNRVDKLDVLIRAEEALLMQFSRTHTRRQKTLDMFKNEQDITGEIGLEELSGFLNESDSIEFDALTERYRTTLVQQHENNRLNKQLLDVKIKFFNHILKTIDNKQQGDDHIVAADRAIIDRRV